MRPYHFWLGPQLAERIEFGLFPLRRWEKCACSLLLTHHLMANPGTITWSTHSRRIDVPSRRIWVIGSHRRFPKIRHNSAPKRHDGVPGYRYFDGPHTHFIRSSSPPDTASQGAGVAPWENFRTAATVARCDAAGVRHYCSSPGMLNEERHCRRVVRCAAPASCRDRKARRR